MPGVIEGDQISWESDGCCTEPGFTICGSAESAEWEPYCTGMPESSDDDDFTSGDMCCSCGGGRSTCDPTPRPSISYSPTPSPTTPAPTTPAPTISHVPTIPPTASWDVGMDHYLNFEDCELDDQLHGFDLPPDEKYPACGRGDVKLATPGVSVSTVRGAYKSARESFP